MNRGMAACKPGLLAGARTLGELDALVLAGLAPTIGGLDGPVVMGGLTEQALWRAALGAGLLRGRS